MANAVPLLLARLMIAWMFLASGHAALSDIAGTAAYFAGIGVPQPTFAAWGTGLFEVGAGLMLAAGYRLRPVAVALAAFALVASFIGHYGQGDGQMAFWHAQMLMKDVAVAGGLIGLAATGAGQLSLDGWTDRRG